MSSRVAPRSPLSTSAVPSIADAATVHRQLQADLVAARDRLERSRSRFRCRRFRFASQPEFVLALRDERPDEYLALHARYEAVVQAALPPPEISGPRPPEMLLDDD